MGRVFLKVGEIIIKQILKQKVSFQRISMTIRNTIEIPSWEYTWTTRYVTFTPPQKV